MQPPDVQIIHQHHPPKPRPKSQWGDIVETLDGSLTIRNPDIDECYHCFQGALFEARSLYVKSSGILERFLNPADNLAPSDIMVLDVGLGLGYNAIATVEAWLIAPSPPDLSIVSLEIEGSLVEAFASGEAPWQDNWQPDLKSASACLKKSSDNSWLGSLKHPTSEAILSWEVYVGDAANSPIPSKSQKYQFVWQDPFSPGKGPALWNEHWFRRLAETCEIGCRLMTFSVARQVKNGLEGSGWQWKRIKGPPPGKRHWLSATWPGAK